MELREQTRQIRGRVKPLRLNKNTIIGEVYDFINWSQIFEKHTPANSIDPRFSLQLEYIQVDYLMESPMRIPVSEYPDIDTDIDSILKIQSATYEFKRRFNPQSGHAVRLTMHTRWTGENSYGPPKAEEFLYNLGQRGYLNFFSPYLIKDSDVDFADADLTIGIAIYEGTMGDFDEIEINAGYSGVMTYYKDYAPTAIKSLFWSINVGTTLQILPARATRIGLYLSNAGTTRVYFAFAENINELPPRASPFIEPGQSASFEFNRVTGSGGHEPYSLGQAYNKYLLTQSVGLIRESGSGIVGYQEFYE